MTNDSCKFSFFSSSVALCVGFWICMAEFLTLEFAYYNNSKSFHALKEGHHYYIYAQLTFMCATFTLAALVMLGSALVVWQGTMPPGSSRRRGRNALITLVVVGVLFTLVFVIIDAVQASQGNKDNNFWGFFSRDDGERFMPVIVIEGSGILGFYFFCAAAVFGYCETDDSQEVEKRTGSAMRRQMKRLRRKKMESDRQREVVKISPEEDSGMDSSGEESQEDEALLK